MKQTLTALLVVLLFATIVVLAAEEATKKSAVDIYIARIKADCEKAIKDADAFYKTYTAPTLKRGGGARDKRIGIAGNKAIRSLTFEKKKASQLDGIKMDMAIKEITKLMANQIGNPPQVALQPPVMKVCGASFKGHTYLAIASGANWKEATELCKKLGGHLAYIETAEELAFLAKTFQGAALWVGATDIHKAGDWRWGNGKPLARNLWGRGEPSGGKDRYATLWPKGEERMLNDTPLDAGISVGGFICEWE